jgi:hypothetical protein
MKTEEAAVQAAPSFPQTFSSLAPVKGATYSNFKWPEGVFASFLRDSHTTASMGVWESHCYKVLSTKAFMSYSARVSLYRGEFLTTGCKEHKVSDALKNLEQEGLFSRVYTRNENGHFIGPMIFTIRAFLGDNPNMHQMHNGHMEPLCTLSTSSMHTSEEERIRKEREASSRPTLNDWLAYAQGIKWCEKDARSAFDYYESVGWIQSGNRPITNWRACARRCSRKAHKTPLIGSNKLKAKIKGIYDGCESPPTYKLMGFTTREDWVKAGCP